MSDEPVEPTEPLLGVMHAPGWRIWRVELADGCVTLLSLFGDERWPPGRAIEAACRRDHRPPAWGCTCGIYALKAWDPWAARSMLFYRPRARVVAVGRVSLGGGIVEAVKGFRAEHAYPYDVIVLDRTDHMRPRGREISRSSFGIATRSTRWPVMPTRGSDMPAPRVCRAAQTSIPSAASASRAASCSAAFFEEPVPVPSWSPSTFAAQVKVRSCGGPSTSSTT
jgi:hypothetical protein